MTARQILEAIVQPDLKTQQAYYRVFGATGDLEKQKKLLRKLGIYPPNYTLKWRQKPYSSTTPRRIVLAHPDALGHELIHRGQFARAGKHSRAVMRNYPAGDTPDYWTHPWEMMAYAYDTARKLEQVYGGNALRALKDGRWRQNDDMRDMIEPYSSDPKAFKRFFRYVAAYLANPQPDPRW